MKFVSYSQLAKDVIAWAQELDQDYDAVIGIPRSGMLVANILALHWNVKFADLESFVNGNFFIGGGRDLAREVKKVLVVDDSILSGKSISRAKKMCRGLPYEMDFGAPYIKFSMRAWKHYKVVPLPRVFEWNVFNHYWLRRACVDIDGVLCRDPTQEENDDGVRYRNFLTSAPPRHIPRVEILSLVTSRLEKYRPETEAWLAKHGVKYQELHMLDLPSKAERIRRNAALGHKASVFENEKYSLFIESSDRQAKGIAALTKKPVLCTDTMVLHGV